jgi:hypothetical protein
LPFSTPFTVFSHLPSSSLFTVNNIRRYILKLPKPEGNKLWYQVTQTA